jgi:A/G-specific adenine glycosylase
MPESLLHKPILDWYGTCSRDLPWRRADATPWAILVSEVMLQQTPVSRVLPVYSEWLDRWPTPGSLADERPGEAIRRWGRLGYPRRALRLHQAATVIEQRHDGAVPSTYDDLRALPGVGDYTAAAVAAFAFGSRVTVVDTNVRRVMARLVTGTAGADRSGGRAERELAASLLPDAPAAAVTWNVAVMELGAVVCTARAPRCDACPVAERCRWRLAGGPDDDAPPSRTQPYAGTDRQCRGGLLQALRDADGPLPLTQVGGAWPDAAQRERALASLLDDGLVVREGEGLLSLP